LIVQARKTWGNVSADLVQALRFAVHLTPLERR
jgi:hypothetical protein